MNILILVLFHIHTYDLQLKLKVVYNLLNLKIENKEMDVVYSLYSYITECEKIMLVEGHGDNWLHGLLPNGIN